jgi:mannose-6-phosphate isomerase-like protein (cupin superfamily)
MIDQVLTSLHEPITFDCSNEIPKGWGKEVQICNLIDGPNNPSKGYAGKFLVYDKKGALSSNHFHKNKSECFYVLMGTFKFDYYNLETGDRLTKTLEPSMVVSIPPCNPHQIKCLSPGVIVEFSSHDCSSDNYRIGKGDSQKKVRK